MQQFVAYFWQICCLRTGPDRAPTAVLFLLLVALTYVAISVVAVLVSLEDIGFLSATGIAIVSLVVQATCVWLLLLYKSLTTRFRATLVTLLGTHSILILLVLPFNVLTVLTESESLRLFGMTTFWMVFGWWLAVAGYIFHRSIHVSVPLGSALAFLIEILSELASSPLQQVP